MSTTALIGVAHRGTSLPIVPDPEPEPATNYPERILAQNPTHYWRLVDLTDEVGGATLTNLNSVAFSRPTLVQEDDSGGSASFQGGASPGHLTQDSSILTDVTSMTVHLVVQPDLVKPKHILFHVEDTIATVNDALSIELVDNGAGALRPRMYRETGSGLRIAVGAGGVIIPAGEPVPLDVVFNASDGSLLVYIGGEAAGMTFSGAAQSTWDAFTSSADLTLGVWQNGTASPLEGLLAEVAIFDRALDAGTIATLSAGTKVAQAIYLAAADFGTVGGTGSFDPASLPTTHPKVGLAAVLDADPDSVIASVNGTWNYDVTLVADGAKTFDGSVLKNALLSSTVQFDLTVDNPVGSDADIPLWPHTDLRQPLVNDDMAIPGGTVRYVQVGGAGTGGSTEGSAGNIQTTLSASSSGDTVVCLPGTYNIVNGLTIPSGVTLMAKPGTAAVISRCVEFDEFQTLSPGASTTWVVHDAAKKIWRSVNTFSPTDSRMIGVWMEDGVAGVHKRPHYLYPYKSLSDLSANVGTGESPTNYSGPGVYLHTDGRVYIRMQKPHPAKYSHESKWNALNNLYALENPSLISGGNLAYPISEDPRDYEIFIARRNSTSAFQPGTGCTVGSGINSVGYRRTTHSNSWGTLTIRRGLHHSYIALAEVSSVTLTGLFGNRMRWTCGGLAHLSVGDFKFQGYLDEGGSGRPECIVQITGGRLVKPHFINCTMQGGNDFYIGINDEARWKYCTIFDVLEEGWQGQPPSRRSVENCYFLAAGMPHAGASGGSNGAGQDYWHHNIWDLRYLHVYWFSDDAGCVPHLPALNHSQSADHPKKAWNNTVLFGPDTVNSQTASFGEVQPNNTGVSTEIFNNITVRMDTQRYSVGGFVSIDVPNDRIQMIMRPESNAHWDFNMYWRDIPSAVQPKWAEAGPGSTDHDSLAALFAATGFEGNGVFAEPQMLAVTDWANNPQLYRAAATSMSSTTQPPSGETWDNSPPSWGTENFDWDTFVISDWNGALDPAGDTMPVGVQNP